MLFLKRRGGRTEDCDAPCAPSHSVKRISKAVNHLWELSSDPRLRPPFHPRGRPPRGRSWPRSWPWAGRWGPRLRLRGHSGRSLYCIQGCVRKSTCVHMMCVCTRTHACVLCGVDTYVCAHTCVSHRTVEQTLSEPAGWPAGGLPVVGHQGHLMLAQPRQYSVGGHYLSGLKVRHTQVPPWTYSAMPAVRADGTEMG